MREDLRGVIRRISLCLPVILSMARLARLGRGPGSSACEDLDALAGGFAVLRGGAAADAFPVLR